MKDGKVIAIIPARGGSKSIPYKNIKEFAGRPLIYWTLRAANDSDVVDSVLIPTDLPRIKKIVDGFRFKKVAAVKRSKASATDSASSETVLTETAKKYRFKDLIFLQATNPFIKAGDIDKAYKLYKQHRYGSLMSAVPQKRFIWDMRDGAASALNYDYKNRPRRQDFRAFFVENGAFYITSRENLLKFKNRLSGKIGIYPMEPCSYFELDEPADWETAEAVFLKKGMHLKEGLNLNAIKLLVLDVDGVFTDGGVYLTRDGERMLKFSRIDGKGIVEFLKAKKSIFVISAEESPIAAKRMEKLKIKEYLFGVKEKWPALRKYLAKNNINLEETAFIGDDIQDLPIIERVGFSACPANAVVKVKNRVDYICRNSGGAGAIREVVDLILK